MKGEKLETVGTSIVCVFATADILISICGHFLDGAVTLRMKTFPIMFIFELLGLSLMIAAFAIRRRGGRKRG